MLQIYQQLYAVLDEEEKLVFRLKGHRQYFDDLEIENKIKVFNQIKTMEQMAATLDALTVNLAKVKIPTCSTRSFGRNI